MAEYTGGKVIALIDAARDVVNNWETGELAAAVRDLHGALDDLGYPRDASTDTRPDAERLLERVQNTQTEVWNALSALEAELGIELDSTRDYQDVTIDALRAEAEEEEEQSNA